jgi:E3 ubiquitin-protein ligase SHPRH
MRAKVISITEISKVSACSLPSLIHPFATWWHHTMAEMDSYDEPASKRRKVSNEVNLQRPDILQRYIPIARASLVVEVAQGEAIEGLCSLTCQHPVNLKAITHGEGAPHILKLTTLNKKSLPDLQICRPSSADADALLVFEDANKLESLWKYSSNISALPLTCARATLTLTHGPTHHGKSSYALEVEILWYNTTVAQDKVTELAVDLLNRYQGSNSSVFTHPVLEPWSPRDFYDNIHVPEKTSEASAKINVDLLQCQLYPFQRRAVRWLLQKEGVQVEPSGHVSPLVDGPDKDAIPDSFRRSVDADGQVCFVSNVFGVVSNDLPGLQARYRGVKGGILAEEMGLGKTVEMIALMCLHRRPDDPQNVVSDDGSPKVSGATLIITPVPILEQWRQEIVEHAPSLKVYQYDGLRTNTRRKSDMELIELLASQDVVLTTYNVIAREIHYVAEKRDRNLRNKAKFDPPKSPLTQISWWRVCLDEAQMIESGVSAAAQVARLIPRENAWAVSGTPLKKDHKDLFGLLLFLQYEPWCQSLRMWNRLLSHHKFLFRNMLRNTAIRHSKDMVREDLRLPPQSRHTITVPFTAIEEQHYAQLFHEMCEDCGLSRDGAPLADDWDPDSATTIEKMRTWLTRLRQTCLHPEVGGRNRRALGRSGGPLRSVLQVLEVMIDQNDTLVRAEQRLMLLSQIRRGQMLENAKQSHEAMEIWLDAYRQSSAIVDECREQLQTEIELHQKQEGSSMNDSEHGEDDNTSEVDTRLMAYRQRLRSALEVKHICIFFLGNAYFQMKSNEATVPPGSDEFQEWERKEEAAYEEAKSIRSELLSEVLRKANRAIEKVRTKAKDGTFVAIPEMRLSLDYGGIESRKVFEKLHHYCEALNGQARQLDQLRDKVMNFLRQSLIDEDEGVELQGDEYEASTKHQDEMYAYMEALRALYADRSDALTGQTNTLIAHEVKMALRAAKVGAGPAPQVLISLMAEREKNRVSPDLGSLRGIIAEIRHLITALQWQEGAGSVRARAELGIANNILQFTQQMSASQTKTITALEQEVGLFRETMNNRLDYYRALQKISDTVAPFEEEKQGKPLDILASARLVAEEEQKSRKISSLLSKRRYLAHLRTEQGSSMPTQRICTICQSDFENGTLTVCGHQFCKDCIRLWWSEHRTCPICKRHLRSTDFYDITYKPAEMAIQEETSPARFDSPGSSERSANRSIYSDVSSATLNQIKNIDLDGSYFGTKVDTICRHLYWLREHDPGSKAIIFSQYREFLDVLGRAFGQYKIAFSRFDDRNGIEKFKSDPAIECFLLHAKAHSTGLNLVVANHVFLCEPLINTAIELQAIARVHRIGQHRATTVWMYLVADTVEESIYDISVTRRLAHIKRATKPATSRSGTATPSAIMETTIDVANSLELQSADLSKLLTSGKSGGEMVDKSDLWTCLFGRVKKRDAGFSAAAEAADREVGRFLRAEAAEERRAGPDT